MSCCSGWSQINTCTVGMTLAQISLGNRKVKEEVHFLKGMKGLVLSWETFQKLEIIPEDYLKQINTVSDANGNSSVPLPSKVRRAENFAKLESLNMVKSRLSFQVSFLPAKVIRLIQK